MPVMSFPSPSAGGFSGTPILIPSGEKTTVPGTFVPLVLVTNPTHLRKLYSVRVTCRAETMMEVLQNGVVIGSGRTGPGSPQTTMTYLAMPLVPGEELLVQILACVGTAPTSVEAYIMAEDIE